MLKTTSIVTSCLHVSVCRYWSGPQTSVTGSRLHVFWRCIQAIKQARHPLQLLPSAADDLWDRLQIPQTSYNAGWGPGDNRNTKKNHMRSRLCSLILWFFKEYILCSLLGSLFYSWLLLEQVYMFHAQKTHLFSRTADSSGLFFPGF